MIPLHKILTIPESEQCLQTLQSRWYRMARIISPCSKKVTAQS
jgi:hypothetical protein